MKRLVTCVAAAAAAAAAPGLAQSLPPTGFEVGQRFPAGLELPDAKTGTLRSLAELRGKKVLLVAFASW